MIWLVGTQLLDRLVLLMMAVLGLWHLPFGMAVNLIVIFILDGIRFINFIGYRRSIQKEPDMPRPTSWWIRGYRIFFALLTLVVLAARISFTPASTALMAMKWILVLAIMRARVVLPVPGGP